MAKHIEKADRYDYFLAGSAGLLITIGGLLFTSYPYLKLSLLLLGLLLTLIAIVRASPTQNDQQKTSTIY